MENKRGQTGGIVTPLVMAIAGLVIATIIAFVIISTLTGAGLLDEGRATFTIANETAAFNGTETRLANFSTANVCCFSLFELGNASDTQAIPLANATITNDGILQNLTAYTTGVDDVNVSFTFQVKSTEEVSTARMSANFTQGVNNVSNKLPTVLLIAAIVLILGVLAILVAVWQRMRLGGGGGI